MNLNAAVFSSEIRLLEMGLKIHTSSNVDGQRWRPPLIAAQERQRQVNFSEYEDSQGHTEKPCRRKPK